MPTTSNQKKPPKLSTLKAIIPDVHDKENRSGSLECLLRPIGKSQVQATSQYNDNVEDVAENFQVFDSNNGADHIEMGLIIDEDNEDSNIGDELDLDTDSYYAYDGSAAASIQDSQKLEIKIEGMDSYKVEDILDIMEEQEKPGLLLYNSQSQSLAASREAYQL